MDTINHFNHASLFWLHEPTKWAILDPNGELEGSGGSFQISSDGKELRMCAPSKKDFWSKTFYNPLLIKSDASALLTIIPNNHEITTKIDFEFEPKSQFDQAGLLIYIDDQHWVKCGIEYCDGSPRLSVVVTNEFSDWSTQPWGSNSVSLKVHKVNQSNSLVVEAAPLGSSDFQFVRIAHLSPYGSHSERYFDF
jgi:regulation of enolase protein 1 (concanavalin A-like superfamily)